MELDLFGNLLVDESLLKKGLSFESQVINTQNGSTPIQEELLKASYAIIGKKKSSRSSRDFRMRSRKTFVQKVFLILIDKFSEEDLQSLLYLDFFQELCTGIMPYPQTSFNTFFQSRPISPYFVQYQNNSKAPKIRHASLKQRFLKLAHSRVIALHPKDTFQLACTLQNLWEQAARTVEHGTHLGSTLAATAGELIQAAKLLPAAYSPVEEKKSLVHISSFKMSPHKRKFDNSPQVENFVKASLNFGYEYFGLAEP